MYTYGTRHGPGCDHMKLAHCKKCHTPIVRWDEQGLRRQADLVALDSHQLAHAWLDGHTTYRVETLHRQQWANPHRPSLFNRRLLADQLRTGQPSRATVLVAHTCGTQVVDVDQALDTWQARDRAAFRPAPTPAPIYEGLPF
jgi:hypothetical protein